MGKLLFLLPPQGQAQGPLGGLGCPNTSLRLSGRLCPWCSESGMPLDSGIPSRTSGPLGALPLVLRILELPWFQNSPPQLLG